MGAVTPSPRVLIVGAGFGGLNAARTLGSDAPFARVLLLDQHNYHTFTPLLYQVASATLEPEEIAYPLRAALRRYHNVSFKMAGVDRIDLESRLVHTDRGDEPYDYLIVAAGSTTNFFGLPGVAEHSHSLKDLPEALALRNRLLTLFERALEEQDPARRRTLLSFVIVGGGPTGVELAGAFSELIGVVLKQDFPSLDPGDVRILLLEAGNRLLAPFRPRLSQAALQTLLRKGIDVRLNAQVMHADANGIALADGSQISTSLLVWAAGVRAADLASDLASVAGSSGRVPVMPTLQLPDHREVYVIGDMAEIRQDDGVLPMLAPVAMQQGAAAARNLVAQMHGQVQQPFRYRDHGTMATIGRSAAVAQIGPLSLRGFPAWLAWLGLHIVELIGFRNKLLVLVNWAWDYIFFQRGVRIIAGPPDDHDSA